MKENCHRLTWKSRLSSRHVDERYLLMYYAHGPSVIFFTVSMNGSISFDGKL